MEKQTLGELAARKLLGMVQERGYTAGDKLPTEGELTALLGVGRNTVREALRILMSRNIVTIRQGSGTFISDKNGVADDPLGLEKAIHGLEHSMEGFGNYWEADSQFHVMIAGCTHNLVMTNLIPVITDGIQVFAGSVRETEYAMTREAHRRIFEAIRDRRPVDAQQAMYFHLMFNDVRYKDEKDAGKY